MSLIQSRRLPRAKLMCALVASCFATQAFANPVGPSVVAGQASFNTVGKSLTVANSPNAIINWQGFSIGAGEITRFQQQSAASAVLNRVVGQDPSAILGTLSSNGRVYLVNPNGILFGQVRAWTAGLRRHAQHQPGFRTRAAELRVWGGEPDRQSGDIVTGSGGRVLLIAPDVQNHGLISTPQGEVVLAAGRACSWWKRICRCSRSRSPRAVKRATLARSSPRAARSAFAGLINQRGVVRAARRLRCDREDRVPCERHDDPDAGSVTSAAGAMRRDQVQATGSVGTAQVDARAKRAAARCW
jgi:filamentous hemagglutinin family protein